MPIPRVWSGRVSKWVFAAKVARCPKCGDKHGGAETGYQPGDEYDRKIEPKLERVCIACK
jgi:hypothetical protein